VVLVITQHNLPKPRTDFGHAIMFPASKLDLDGLELRNHSLLRSDPTYGEGSALVALPTWLQSAKGTALANFAGNLIRDQAAVLAALQTPWSNGQVEGQVHRLKLVKRQMYGRASFELLRLPVLNTT
jgi:transposase